MTTKDIKWAAGRALSIQHASNLSGIVATFHDVMSVLWEEARKRNEGTDWVNKHPVSKLFAAQINWVSTGQIADLDYSNWVSACEKTFRGEED